MGKNFTRNHIVDNVMLDDFSQFFDSILIQSEEEREKKNQKILFVILDSIRLAKESVR